MTISYRWWLTSWKAYLPSKSMLSALCVGPSSNTNALNATDTAEKYKFTDFAVTLLMMSSQSQLAPVSAS